MCMEGRFRWSMEGSNQARKQGLGLQGCAQYVHLLQRCRLGRLRMVRGMLASFGGNTDM